MNLSPKKDGYFSGDLPPECYSNPRTVAGDVGCLSFLLLPALASLGFQIVALVIGARSWWSWLFLPFSGWIACWLIRSIYSDNRPLTGLALTYSPWKHGDYEHRRGFPVVLRQSLWLDELAWRNGTEGLRGFKFQRYGQARPIQIWHPALEIKERTEMMISLVLKEPAFERKDLLVVELEHLREMLARAHANNQQVAFYLHH